MMSLRHIFFFLGDKDILLQVRFEGHTSAGDVSNV